MSEVKTPPRKFFTVNLRSLTLVRYKQLKGGRLVVRSIKNVKVRTMLADASTTEKCLIDIPVKTRLLRTRVKGSLSSNTGILNLDVEDTTTRGYLKRAFKVVGYDIDARVTNTSSRLKGEQLTAKAPKQGPLRQYNGKKKFA